MLWTFRLRRKLQAAASLRRLLQDEVMQIVYGIDSKAVLHGGTSIWRCYGGKGFPEDLILLEQNP